MYSLKNTTKYLGYTKLCEEVPERTYGLRVHPDLLVVDLNSDPKIIIGNFQSHMTAVPQAPTPLFFPPKVPTYTWYYTETDYIHK